MKKSGIFSLLFALVLLLSVPLVNADAATTFKDVENGRWSEEQINRTATLGIVTGYEDGTFRPEQALTREEAAIILSKALKLDTTNAGTVNFKDVSSDRHAYEYIAAVNKEKLMVGYNGNFNPTAPLTRQDMAVVIKNTFELQDDGAVPFTDVTKNYAYDAISALYSKDIATGYTDNTFKPKNSITREEFIMFLDRALNETPMADYLKEVYANEAALTSYEFEGSMNLGLAFPELSIEESEDAEVAMVTAMLAEMFSDIKISMTGAYQLNPMLFEANISVTLKGEPSITLDMPIIMTADKMWMKFPENPLFPAPEEFAGKYIELDMAELTELSGQPAPTMNLNLQTEFGLAIQNLFFDHFADGFYKQVSKEEIGLGNNGNVQKVVKFELTNETLVSFVDILMNKFMPEFVELLNTPGYAEALGFTAEDLELFSEVNTEELEEMISEIQKTVKINELSQYDAIHKDKYILSTKVKIDVDLTMTEEDTLGLKLAFNLNKKNVNVPVQITVPDESQVVPFESLFQFDEELYVEDVEDTEENNAELKN